MTTHELMALQTACARRGNGFAFARLACGAMHIACSNVDVRIVTPRSM